MSTKDKPTEIRVPTWSAWYEIAEEQFKDAYSLRLRFRPDDAEVYATYQLESETAVPSDVWHGLVRQYRPAVERGLIDAAAFGEWLASDDVQALLARIAGGYSVEWDGANHKGRLTDDAAEAEEQLQEWLGQVPAREDAGFMDAGSYLIAVGPDDFGITAETTDEEIETIARAERRTARQNEIIVDGLEPYMRTWRDES